MRATDPRNEGPTGVEAGGGDSCGLDMSRETYFTR